MKDFSMEVCSDLDYEQMVVDINCENRRIATISCDNGIENTRLVIFDSMREKVIWKLDYFSFSKILNASFEKLKEINERGLP